MALTAAELRVKVGAETAGAEQELRSFGQRMGTVARNLGGVGVGLSLGVTAPIVGAAKAVFGLGTSFESAFTGVIKTVDATDAEIAALRDGILDMATRANGALPATVEEISGVAEAAGQLGIATENILSFSETMIHLGESTNLASTTAASELARFANITQMPQTAFDRLGSTIVALGNNLATTEADIVSMGMRIAGAGAQIGMSEALIMSIAGALSSVGIEAEAGGTAISRVMIDMANAVAMGGEELAGFAAVAGMSSQDFAKAFQDDAALALVTFIEGLGALREEGANVFAVLEDLGMADIRVRDALLRASGAGDLFRESLELGTKAWEENIALTQEAELRYGTTESKLSILGNRVRGVGLALMDALGPQLGAGMGMLDSFSLTLMDMASGLGDMNPALLNASLAFGAVLAAAGPVSRTTGRKERSTSRTEPIAGPLCAATINRSTSGRDVSIAFASCTVQAPGPQPSGISCTCRRGFARGGLICNATRNGHVPRSEQQLSADSERVNVHAQNVVVVGRGRL